MRRAGTVPRVGASERAADGPGRRACRG